MARSKLEVSAAALEAARGKLKELAARKSASADALLPLKADVLAAVKQKATLKEIVAALAGAGVSVSTRTLSARIKEWKK